MSQTLITGVCTASTSAFADEMTNISNESNVHQEEVVKTGLKYRADIDGLRAVAVLSVLAFHIGLSRFRGGFVGVDVFFVISGYLIGSLVYKEIRGRNFSIAKF